MCVLCLGPPQMRRHRALGMATPPRLQIGQYYVTRPWWSQVRCKAYDAPPPHGQYIATIDPRTYLGPVEDYRESPFYKTICVRGQWINVWGSGVHFAFLVPDWERQEWTRRGWVDETSGTH